MVTSDRSVSRYEYGPGVLMVMVMSSSLVTDWTPPRSRPPSELISCSNSGELLMAIRLRFQTAASAFHGEPSWNLTPGRSLKVHVEASGLTVQDSARPGLISGVWSPWR